MKALYINTSKMINSLPYNDELRKVFEQDTNWDATLIDSNEDIKEHYINWLQYQLYQVTVAINNDKVKRALSLLNE